MRRPALLALSVAVVTAAGVVPSALASQPVPEGSAEIVLDLPPDYVRYGAELPLTGTVFGADGRRAVKNPVAVAVVAPGSDDDLVWSKTVTTDGNGRFRTSVRGDASTGEAVLLAPLLNTAEGSTGLAEEHVPSSVKVLYPVTLRLTATSGGDLAVNGASPECEGAVLQVEAGLRGTFSPLGDPVPCVGGVARGLVSKPGPGYQYRLVRAADDTGVRAVSPVVTIR